MTTVEAWYSAEQREAVVLADEAAVDALLQQLAADSAARLVSLVVGDGVDSIPTVEFLVGIGGDVPLGVLRVADADGLWISKNPNGALDGEPVGYHYMGVGEPFPPDAELPLDEVRAAVLEYVRTGKRPMSVQWQGAS